MVVHDAEEPEGDCMGEEGLGSLKLKPKCSRVCSGQSKKKKNQPNLLFSEQPLPCSEVPELLWTGSFISKPELIAYSGASQLSTIAALIWALQLD